LLLSLWPFAMPLGYKEKKNSHGTAN